MKTAIKNNFGLEVADLNGGLMVTGNSEKLLEVIQILVMNETPFEFTGYDGLFITAQACEDVAFHFIHIA